METVLIVSSILLWVVVLLNVLLTFGLVRRFNKGEHKHEPPSLDMLNTGQPAPDFSAQTLDDAIVTLSSYAERRVAFQFFSTGCEPCHDFIPKLEQLRPQATSEGVEIILVSSDDMEKTRAFIERMNIHLPVLVAPRKSNPFFEAYKANFTPSYTLVNGEGIVESAGLPHLVDGSWEKLTKSWTPLTSSLASERR